MVGSSVKYQFFKIISIVHPWYSLKTAYIFCTTLQWYVFMATFVYLHLLPELFYESVNDSYFISLKQVGGIWQPDAIELLQELLSKREVEIHIMVICT